MSTLQGRLIDNIWHCDCNPRLRANYLQTKNHGLNHGRWFYRCQQPQYKGCKFFLWEDDAIHREKIAVYPNTRSKLDRTPSKPLSGIGLLTPETGSTKRALKWTGVDDHGRLFPKIETGFEGDDIFDRVDVVSEDAGSFFTGPLRQPNFTPQQQIGTVYSRKRDLSEMEDDISTEYRTAIGSPTPRNSQAENSRLVSPSASTPTSRNSSQVEKSLHYFPEFPATPTPTPNKHANPPTTNSTLEISGIAAEALALLQFHDVVLPSSARDGLVTLLDKFDLKTKGIIRGRDISRVTLKEKDEQIQELGDRIKRLKNEAEMNRAVIANLKIRR